MTRIGYGVIAVILMMQIAFCFGPHSPAIIPSEFFYPIQSFECIIEDEGVSLRIAQAITVYCTDGCLEKINITIPYGEKEIQVEKRTQNNSVGLEVLTPSTRPVPRSIKQNQSHTKVIIELPYPIYKDQDTVLVLRYRIDDLPGDKGVSRPVMSLMDKLLRRDPSRFEITYNLGIFEDRVDELIVRIFPPLDSLPKRWEPESNTFKLYDPATGRVSINWHLTENIPKIPIFKLLIEKGRRPNHTSIILSILILMVIVGITLAYPHLRRYRARS